MSASERAIAVVVGEWVEKAENDLKNAALTLSAGGEAPADTVAFHAQQCVGKYLKAVLTHREIDFPKTHDIEELVVRAGLCAGGIRPSGSGRLWRTEEKLPWLRRRCPKGGERLLAARSEFPQAPGMQP